MFKGVVAELQEGIDGGHDGGGKAREMTEQGPF